MVKTNSSRPGVSGRAGAVLGCAAAALLPALDADVAAAESPVAIVCTGDAPPLAILGAREIRRYVYLRTGELMPIRESLGRGDAILLTTRATELAPSGGQGPESYRIETEDDATGRRVVRIVGGGELGTLYGAYRLCEHLGIRFYLHGDTIPDARIALELPEIEEERAPLFALRGIQPFHDFPEGPDWWDRDDYKAIIAQLPKLGMNFIGLHTYPEARPNAEPTTWIGQPDDVGDGKRVLFAYPASYYNTALDVNWGFARKATGHYRCGGSLLFDRDDYGSEIMRGLTPRSGTPEEHIEIFERTADLLDDAFTLARRLGVRTCIGTETPLVIPKLVQERTAGKDISTEDLYAGMFERIRKSHPLDYYWLWTPENWTWEGVKEADVANTVRDIQAAHAALKRVNAPFSLATCGWVLGPQYDRAHLDKVLPKDVAMSCISRNVGHDPVEPGFADVTGRGKWAIPWLEDDPAMTSLQLWAGRMRSDARDALRHGCTGLMGIHWRTRTIAPNVAALAQAAWDQDNWPGQSLAESCAVGGETAAFGEVEISDTEDDALYRSVRYNMDAYRIIAPNGRYRVTLHFCEPHYNEAGKRVFGVRLEGRQVIAELDVFALAGRNRAVVRTFDDVDVTDGVLDVDFVKGIEFPCIAAIAVEGAAFAQRFNCGGGAHRGFGADLPKVMMRVLASDFYLDWARSEFGAGVAEDAARVFSAVDCRLPRPSDWIGGPGGYQPDLRPWDEVKQEYGFVDGLAALGARVEGAGNRARFGYWLAQCGFLRASARMECAWGVFVRAMDEAKKPADAAARSRMARDSALPAYVAMLRSVEEAYAWLLRAVDTTGEMGTVSNLEQHTFPAMIEASAAELVALTGAPLPGDAQLRGDHAGPPRLVVPAKRGSLERGEPLRVRVAVLDSRPVTVARAFWREMGSGGFAEQALERRGGGVFEATLAAASGEADLEYHVEVVLTGGDTLRWPATAPVVNQTVVRMPW